MVVHSSMALNTDVDSNYVLKVDGDINCNDNVVFKKEKIEITTDVDVSGTLSCTVLDCSFLEVSDVITASEYTKTLEVESTATFDE